MRALTTLMVVVVAAVLGVNVLGDDRGTPSAPDEATVLQVTDGDTIVLNIGGTEERVRLIGIDTPESVDPNEPAECYGKEASQRLAELLPVGSVVRLERDVEPRDRYDRLLAYIYRTSDGLFVNLDQVGQGFAEASEYPPNVARSADLEAAESAAKSANIGLWALCGGTDTPVSP